MFNGSLSKCRLVVNGIPQELVLGPAQFKMFLVDIGSGSKCTFRDFVDDTKLCSMMSTLEGRDVIQRELGRLDTWACRNLRKLNNAKCKILHLSFGNPKHKYKLGKEYTVSSPMRRRIWWCWLMKRPV